MDDFDDRHGIAWVSRYVLCLHFGAEDQVVVDAVLLGHCPARHLLRFLFCYRLYVHR